MILIRVAAFALALVPLGASAQTFCKVQSSNYVPGQPISTTIKTVVSTVSRPSNIPGRTRSNWCNLSFNSNNQFYKPIEVTKKPALGN